MDATALAAKLNDSDPGVRAAAAEDLAHLAEGAQSAAVPLVQAMGDADEDVRNWAYAALESLGTPRPEDVPALIKIAADPRLDVAYWAVTLLGRFGGANFPGAAQMRRALAGTLDSNAEVAVRQALPGAGAIRRGGKRGKCSIDQGQFQFRSPVGAIGKRSDRKPSVAAAANSDDPAEPADNACRLYNWAVAAPLGSGYKNATYLRVSNAAT